MLRFGSLYQNNFQTALLVVQQVIELVLLRLKLPAVQYSLTAE